MAEIIWLNRQQIRQLEMIQESLNIPPQEVTINLLPELSEGLSVLLDTLVKRFSNYFSLVGHFFNLSLSQKIQLFCH